MSELDDLEDIATFRSADGRKPRHNIHQLSKTHCARGHEFNEENTRIGRYRGRQRRVCRICHREDTAKAKAKGDIAKEKELLRQLKAKYEP